MDWATEIRTAGALVERWVERVEPDGWLQPRDATWNNKDLLGHLAAWSNLLIDEVEALRQGRPDAIGVVDVDAWNAVQVTKRRNRSADAIVDEWRESVQRAAGVAARLPAHLWGGRWRVAWAHEPVSIDDLLRLWLMHLEQHRARLTATWGDR